MKQCTDDQGFTLIEVLVAMVVLSIGIFSLYAMQTSSLKGNTFAFGQTVAATLGMNEIETILASPYNAETIETINGIDDDHNGIVDDASDFMLGDTNGDGVAGLGNTVAAGVINSDYNRTIQDAQGINYTVYWNIAEDVPLLNAKTVRVIVTRVDMGATRAVDLTYYKHNTF